MPTILIVDDSSMMRALVRDALEADRHEVVEARDGTAALAVLEKTIPSLVITDVLMPEMDGLTLARRLRADARFQRLPILVLTTEDGDATKASGRSAGVTGWLVKPFDPTALRATVRHVLETHG
jgi:two-component system chemotaxis response regulator CheY